MQILYLSKASSCWIPGRLMWLIKGNPKKTVLKKTAHQGTTGHNRPINI